MVNPKRPRTPCLHCGNEPDRSYYKYCSNACQLAFQSKDLLVRWKKGEVSGLQKIGVVSGFVKNYLRIKFGNKCCLCGWSKVNPKSGLVPLVADHIDGNWKNNREENLRLLCPNCDSLTTTFAALNRGNGRPQRILSSSFIEARKFLRKRPKH